MDVDHSHFDGNGSSNSMSGDDNVPKEEVDYTPLDRVLPHHGSAGQWWRGLGCNATTAALSPHRRPRQWEGATRTHARGGKGGTSQSPTTTRVCLFSNDCPPRASPLRRRSGRFNARGVGCVSSPIVDITGIDPPPNEINGSLSDTSNTPMEVS